MCVCVTCVLFVSTLSVWFCPCSRGVHHVLWVRWRSCSFRVESRFMFSHNLRTVLKHGPTMRANLVVSDFRIDSDHLDMRSRSIVFLHAPQFVGDLLCHELRNGFGKIHCVLCAFTRVYDALVCLLLHVCETLKNSVEKKNNIHHSMTTLTKTFNSSLGSEIPQKKSSDFIIPCPS